MLPLVALVTVAGIISLGLAVLASWALLTILLLILEAKAEAHRLKPRAVLRMDRKQPIPNATPENSGAGSEECKLDRSRKGHIVECGVILCL